MFAFADPEIIRLATTEFVPVCADDWYQRRRSDAEGAFWRRITLQGPRGADAPTHQGIYIFTADGELLAFKNAGQDVKATRDQLQDGLSKWKSLPAFRRQAGALAIPAHGPLDPNYTRTPPMDGAIVRAHSRILDRDGNRYRKGTCDFPGGDRSARDFLWLTADDLKSLSSIPPSVGHSIRIPDPLRERLLRFHLVDNTRGEPDFWNHDEIQTSDIVLSVDKTNPESIELNLDGTVSLSTRSDPVRAYDARLSGRIRVSRAGKLERFDIVAIGEHRGAGTFTARGVRSGLLGVAFELVDPEIPANRVPPQGSRDPEKYFGPK